MRAPRQASPARAAIPRYAGRRFDDAPPGHRFGLYFECWDERFQKAGDAAFRRALARLRALPPSSTRLLDGLSVRQRHEAGLLGPERVLTLGARSTSPFVTGLGIEHPTENGFRFLDPYGLPVLPGSSVKGVVRSAAEALALAPGAGARGWSPLAVWWLFGFEPGSAYLAGARGESSPVADLREEADRRRRAYLAWIDERERSEAEQALARALVEAMVPSRRARARWAERLDDFLGALAGTPPDDADHALEPRELKLQGALRFWDVLVRPAGDTLDLDVLTPHLTHYYRDGQPPHDAGQPVPNAFLATPPGSELVFHVECAAAHLPAPLAGRWQALARAAFEHAFEWLGFGAKTAVGYGQLAEAPDVLDEAEEATRAAGRSPLERRAVEWIEAGLEAVMKADRSPSTAALASRTLAQRWTAIDEPELKEAVRDALERRWKAAGRPPSKKARAIYDAG